MVKQLQHWINGEYASGKPAGEIKIEDPALGEVIATIPSASSEDLDEAVKIAQKAQKEWAKISLAKRVDIMFKMRHLVLENQDKMARLIVQEHGKKLFRCNRGNPARTRNFRFCVWYQRQYEGRTFLPDFYRR